MEVDIIRMGRGRGGGHKILSRDEIFSNFSILKCKFANKKMVLTFANLCNFVMSGKAKLPVVLLFVRRIRNYVGTPWTSSTIVQAGKPQVRLSSNAKCEVINRSISLKRVISTCSLLTF